MCRDLSQAGVADAAGLPGTATNARHASRRASKVNRNLTNQDGNTRRTPGPQRCPDGDYEEAVDRLVAAYVDWREESIAAREAYSRCGPTRGQKHREAFAVYFAALDREERAAAEYAGCVEEVCALVSADALFVAAEAGAGCAPTPQRRPKERP